MARQRKPKMKDDQVDAARRVGSVDRVVAVLGEGDRGRDLVDPDEPIPYDLTDKGWSA